MTNVTTPTTPAPKTINRQDGSTIAYHLTPGKSPGVVFMGGFMSDMTGSKALHMEEFSKRRGQAFLRFDYTGHGASSGAFEDGTIGAWADDAVFALERLCEGSQVLAGSSMGGWIMLLAALRCPERVAALLGIAAAPDFTEDLMAGQLSAGQREALERDGMFLQPSDYGEEMTPITKALIEDGKNHLVLRRKIPLHCPVRLIHGMRDPDVPWQTALQLSRMLVSADVEVQLVKDGEHRLSEPQDLDRLSRTLGALLDELEE